LLEQSLHRFGPFIIVRTLGRGGMGEVFIARTPWDENPLAAVKRLRPDVARVPTFADRFKHEAELAVRLDHPNVVGTLDVGSVEGQIYVCSELVLGKDAGIIADRLGERGQGGPAAVAIRLLIDALAGLAYVHGAREPDGRPLELLHRDITPGNVLIGYDGIARLADFGLAKSLLTERAQLTNHGEILGTPHYLAPEVIRGEGASPASDIYGLGAVMYRFLTGVAPHQGTTAEVLMRVLSEQPKPLSDLRPDLPPWIVAFVHRMLETDSTRRPFDASVLLKQLQHDARASGLLVPRASVERWIGSLFESEKTDELEERDRIAAIDPDSLPDKPEGTVVLAHPRSESRLTAPKALWQEDLDSQGTELELSENDVRAIVTGAGPRLSAMKRRPPAIKPSLGVHVPNDVTDAQAKPSPFEGISFDEDSAEAMPTRAGSLFPSPREVTPREAVQPEPQRARPLRDPARAGRIETPEADTLDPETRARRANAKVGFATEDPALDSNHDTKLPGFIDDEPRRARAKEVPNGDDSPTSRSKREPPSAPAAAPVAARMTRPMPKTPPSAAVVDPTAPPSGPRALPLRERPRASEHSPASLAPINAPPVVKPPGPTNPKIAPAPSSSGQTRPKRMNGGSSKNLLVLAALLAIAILMGVGIGVIVASLKRPTQLIVESPIGALKDRLVRLKNEMDARTKRGEPVEARAWELVATAGLAISDNDGARAEASLSELERLLGHTGSSIDAASATPAGGT
jgi:eukaryotic-like serine/threonine-protein kinase